MIYRCREAFSYDEKGIPRVMRPGDVVTDQHPGYRLAPSLFDEVETAADDGVRDESVTADDEPAEVVVEERAEPVAPVETADATPGRKRTRTRTRSRSTTKE